MKPVLVAGAFLTRLPLPDTGPVDETTLGRAVGWFPWVGLLLGGMAAAVGLATPLLGAPLAAVLQLALLAVVTGGLHLDGLADCFDALGAGKGPERSLEIMRDSRIGAHGAVALVFVVLAQVVALAQVGPDRLAAVLLLPVVSRAVLVHVLIRFPYVRPQGLGRALKDHAGLPQLLRAWLPALLALPLLGTGPAVAGIGGALLAGMLFAWAMHRRLGGLTGDVYGACTELAALGYLVGLLVAGS